MPVDAVPHHFTHETTDLPEAVHAVEFARSHRVLVADLLGDEARGVRQWKRHGVIRRAGSEEVGLAGARPDARLHLHAIYQRGEVARWQIQIEVELANVVECLRGDGFESSVERFDHAAPY